MLTRVRSWQWLRLLGLPLLGLPGSRLQTLSQGRCPFIAEGFADRRYLPDGSLVPRSQADAFVEDPAEAVAQVEGLIRDRGVQTICVHGDNPQALAFVRELRGSEPPGNRDSTLSMRHHKGARAKRSRESRA